MTNDRSASSNILRFCSAIALSASIYGTAEAASPSRTQRHVAVLDDAGRQWAEDGRGQDPVPRAEAARYTCPMHPEVVADSPGRCPHCGMKLVEQEQDPKMGEGL